MQMVTIVDPHIKRDSGWRLFKEAEEKGLYVKNKDGADFDGCASSWCREHSSCIKFVSSCTSSTGTQPVLTGAPLTPPGAWPGLPAPTFDAPAILTLTVPQLVLAGLFVLPGHAVPRCARLVGAAVLHKGLLKSSLFVVVVVHVCTRDWWVQHYVRPGCDVVCEFGALLPALLSACLQGRVRL